MVLWGSVLFHLIAFAVLIEGKSSESSSIPYHIRRHLAESVQKEELISGINPAEDLLADPGSIGQRGKKNRFLLQLIEHQKVTLTIVV